MNNRKVSVFFGVFALSVLMVVIVSAFSTSSWSLDLAFEEEGYLTGLEELEAKADLIQAGYDLESREYSAEDILDIVHLMEEDDDQYGADWNNLAREMSCFYDWEENREPGEIFMMQGNRIISYCLPSGEAPWVVMGDEILEDQGATGDNPVISMLGGDDGPGGSDDNWRTNEDGTTCTGIKNGWLGQSKPHDYCSIKCTDNQAQCNQCGIYTFSGSDETWDRGQSRDKCTEVWAP